MSITDTTKGESKETTSSKELVSIFVMGKKYEVPKNLTIMKAMEYAGYKYIRGCGCRGGICGACGTVYRKPGDYHIYVGLACQTVVEDGMYLTQLPFFPANRATYNLEAIGSDPEEVYKKYPELFRCVACNACTKVCPMDISVMDYISAIKQGDFEKATELSFDCIQCGLCTVRCMGEMSQYHIAQMVRRVTGSKIKPKASHLKTMVDNIKTGRYTKAITDLKSMSEAQLRKVYPEREMEPTEAPEDWKPADTTYL